MYLGKLLLCTFLLQIFLFSSPSQAQPKERFTARLDFEKTDGSNIIRGWFRNNEVLASVFQYNFIVFKKASKDSTRSSFRAATGKKNMLSKAVLFFKERHPIEKVKLEIFRYGELVAVDSIITSMPETIAENPEKELPKAPVAIPKTPTFDELEIDGLILDETRSKLGHDFYEYFYNAWVAPQEAKDFIITIRELPARGRVAQIAIEINDQTLVKRFLQPRSELIENLAVHLVEVAKNHLTKMENLKQEILTEDLKGSGIF